MLRRETGKKEKISVIHIVWYATVAGVFTWHEALGARVGWGVLGDGICSPAWQRAIVFYP